MRTHLTILMFIFTASSAVAATCDTAGRFTAGTDGDGTAIVTDSKTGLTWKKCLEGFSGADCATAGAKTTFTWSEALNLTVAGSWRVPNIKELQSIVDEGKSTLVDLNDSSKGVNPAIDTACFPTPSNTHFYVWSASPYAGNAANSWLIDFNDGIFYNILPQTSPLNVRLVKP